MPPNKGGVKVAEKKLAKRGIELILQLKKISLNQSYL